MERLARLLLVVLGALTPLAVAWAETEAPKRSTLQAEVERLRGYQARQKLGVKLLDGISKSLPELLWLDRLNVSNGQIVIDGRAFNTNAIANFIENLDKLPEFDEPLLRSTSQESDTTFKFNLLMRISRPPTGNTSLEAERDSLLHRLAAQSELPEILERLRTLLEHPAIKVEKFVSLPRAGKGRREQVLPVEVRIRAESYKAAALLFDRLGRFPSTVALDRMNAVPDQATVGTLTVDFRLAVPVLKKRAGDPREARETEEAGPEATASLARQPFQALTLDEATQLRRLRPEGVAGLRIADLDLRAIFRTSKGYVAQVLTREENKSYLLKERDQLFDGEVVRITKDEAVFRQTRSAEGSPREVTLSLKTP